MQKIRQKSFVKLDKGRRQQDFDTKSGFRQDVPELRRECKLTCEKLGMLDKDECGKVFDLISDTAQHLDVLVFVRGEPDVLQKMVAVHTNLTTLHFLLKSVADKVKEQGESTALVSRRALGPLPSVAKLSIFAIRLDDEAMLNMIIDFQISALMNSVWMYSKKHGDDFVSHPKILLLWQVKDIGRVLKQQLLLLSRPSFLGRTSLLVERARAIGSRCVSAWHNKAFSPVIEI